MSRTDKDEPWWVDPVAWAPEHYRCGYVLRWWAYSQNGVCDLPAEPRRGRVNRPSRWRNRNADLWTRCVWEPVDDRRYADGSVPGDYVMATWTGPDRARVRADCRRAVVEHRATGEVDVIPRVEQHRHRAGWSYW